MTRDKWFLKLCTHKCSGGCGDPSFHTHDLSALGRWHFVYRYRLQDMLFTDRRPQPVPGDWYREYVHDWTEKYPDNSCQSCWVRDTKEHWIWVTETPGFDQKWFDAHHMQFPAMWITPPSKEFYTIGFDDICTIVNLEELS